MRGMFMPSKVWCKKKDQESRIDAEEVWVTFAWDGLVSGAELRVG